jgi:uncharacterized repeat protein (TIGR03803 family)
MDRWSYNTSIQVGDAIYGTRAIDPPAGCVYRTEKDGSRYTVLHSFGGRRGYSPDGLVAVGGVLYGVTRWGGPGYRPRIGSMGHGVLYRLTLDGAGFEVLHDFTRSEGSSPRGALAYVGGLVYGTTSETLFRMRPNGTGFATLHHFGRFIPEGGLIASNGVLYGVVSLGGDDRLGTAFRFDTLSERFHTLRDFKGPDGSLPPGGVVLNGTVLRPAEL